MVLRNTVAHALAQDTQLLRSENMQLKSEIVERAHERKLNEHEIAELEFVVRKSKTELENQVRNS